MLQISQLEKVDVESITKILNDNGMSIEKNTGGLARLLTKMRTRKFYSNSNRIVKELVLKSPKFGNWVIKVVRRIKHKIKRLLLPDMFFEDIGFKYLGPVDGNDIEKLEALIERAKDFDGPVLIHCKTLKGKGYKPAEENPDKFHSASSFDIETGKSLKKKNKDYSKAFGQKLVKIAEKNDKVVAITAAMTSGTGLTEFKEKFPDRFFDVEIAEQHAMTMAAGLASAGCVPVVALYSSFLQRAYDQVIHDVCMQNLHVVICIDRAGIVGADGETHQGVFDLSFLNIVPNLTIMAPKNYEELDTMMEYAINEMNSPVAIRYPRGNESDIKLEEDSKKQIERIKNNKAEIIKEGKDITIIAIGKMVSRAVEVAELLEKENVDVEIINASFFKPLDKETIKKSITKTKKVITIEDGILKGGLYSAIAELINEEQLKEIKLKGFGYPDKFIEHGTCEELEKIYGMDAESIIFNFKKTEKQ